MSESLARKNLLTIGASRGLGYARTEEYLRLGWHVVATGRAGSVKRLQDLVTKCAGNLEVETVDMNLADEVAALHARVRARRFDLLIVNAGIHARDGDQCAEPNAPGGIISGPRHADWNHRHHVLRSRQCCQQQVRGLRGLSRKQSWAQYPDA
jgi:NAD(P)-dependent dehydrogenase (short-subunit alcohol dehydrogenase family)